MTEITGLILTGIVISVLILAVKSGLGCGLSNLKRKEIFYIASSYFVVSILIGLVILTIPFESTQRFLAIGVFAHVVMAIGMILLGLHTIKEWQSKKHDVSRRTFLCLSVPCPACLAATFLACFMLTEFTNFNDFLVGPAVGALFFVGITATSFSANRFRKSPSTLGNVMLFIGLFYILSILLIPAYIQSKSVIVPEIPMELGKMAISLIFMGSLIIIGYLGRRTKWKSHQL
jgi:predicted transporter